MSLSAYPSYRASDIVWIASLPSHWSTRRLKTLFRLMRRATEAGDKIVTAFRDGQVTLRERRREEGFTNALQEIGYQGVRTGDLVIHAMDGFAGAIGVSDADGKSTPVYSVCTPGSDADARYFALLLRHMALSGFITALARGVRERSTDFRWSDASILNLPCPPLAEQRAIVAFLDRETAKIDALVGEQQRLVELLKEKRQTVISHAVTKGLDPTVPMKDSGVDWLGQVPAHWTICALSHRYTVQLGKMLDEKRITGDHLGPYLRNSDVQWGRINVDDLPSMDFPGEDLARFSLRSGDLLVCEGGEVGRAAVWNSPIEPCYYQKALHRLRPLDTSRESPKFFYYVLSSAAPLGVFSGGAEKATIAHLPAEQFRRYRFAFPPMVEQVEIAAQLDRQLSRIDGLVMVAEKATQLLLERRAALISAAVTGKIDVRGTATQRAEAA